MTHSKLNPHIELWLGMVEKEKIAACKEQHQLAKHIRKCFDEEDIYTDEKQLENYLSLLKYFPYERLYEWEEFLIALHDCTYWEKTGLPRWPDLLCLIGRGAGKDGFIAFESTCLISPYNGIKNYDIDICANNEMQALTPLKDIINAFEGSPYEAKLKGHFYWTKQGLQSKSTKSMIKGRTNSPQGKDGLRSGKVAFNEVHQYDNYDNINVFTTGLGKKPHPRRGYYTTDGDVKGGVLSDIKNTSRQILEGAIPDNGLLPFICKLDSEEEVHNKKNWEKANPSLRHKPELFAEIEKEYLEWKESPVRLPAFMTKRMNLPAVTEEKAVTSWENIEKTNKELPDLSGWECVVGIDLTKVTDLASVNFRFRKGDLRYDINHSWICLKSKDIPRIKAPWRAWAEDGKLTIVDDVEIHPDLLCDYIYELGKKYKIKMIAIDNFRYAIMSKSLERIGFSAMNKNVKLLRLSDQMIIAPIIDRCFANGWFIWGDNPVLRWATNNTKLIPFKKQMKGEDNDMGNFVYAKIEAKSRKTDPFMSVVATAIIEDEINIYNTESADLGVFTF